MRTSIHRILRSNRRAATPANHALPDRSTQNVEEVLRNGSSQLTNSIEANKFNWHLHQMVKVIPRVRALADLLAERGFTPLASAILRGLDQGVLLSSEERPVEAGKYDDRPTRVREPERIWRPETRAEQAKFVADIVVDQLITPLKMRERSAELLSRVMDSEVSIGSLGPEGELLSFARGAAADLIGEGINLAQELQAWLAAEEENEAT